MKSNNEASEMFYVQIFIVKDKYGETASNTGLSAGIVRRGHGQSPFLGLPIPGLRLRPRQALRRAGLQRVGGPSSPAESLGASACCAEPRARLAAGRSVSAAGPECSSSAPPSPPPLWGRGPVLPPTGQEGSGRLAQSCDTPVL